jgi:hypothetical protein
MGSLAQNLGQGVGVPKVGRDAMAEAFRRLAMQMQSAYCCLMATQILPGVSTQCGHSCMDHPNLIEEADKVGL